MPFPASQAPCRPRGELVGRDGPDTLTWAAIVYLSVPAVIFLVGWAMPGLGVAVAIAGLGAVIWIS